MSKARIEAENLERRKDAAAAWLLKGKIKLSELPAEWREDIRFRAKELAQKQAREAVERGKREARAISALKKRIESDLPSKKWGRLADDPPENECRAVLKGVKKYAYGLADIGFLKEKRLPPDWQRKRPPKRTAKERREITARLNERGRRRASDPRLQREPNLLIDGKVNIYERLKIAFVEEP